MISRILHLQLILTFALVLLGTALLWSQSGVPQTPVDPTRLEAVEDLSESFANDMLELSVAVRDRDLKHAADFFSETIATDPFPSQPGPLKTELKWIRSHSWVASTAATQPIKREVFVKGWAEFLEHFAEIEDVRFKVKQAAFDDPKVAFTRSRVAFFIVGRDMDGRREWVRGTAQVQARLPGNKPWKIESFTLSGMDSMVADADIFSEVSVPAGVDATISSYGSPANSGFAWNGAAAGDLNDDGLIDLFVTGIDRNYLYLNNGKGGFLEVSKDAGVDLLLNAGTQPLLLDYDNDGDLDVFISAVGSQMLLENRLKPEGKFVFRDVSMISRIDKNAIGFGAAAGDVNGDGLPDIYVASYNRYGVVTPDSWFRATNGTPNLLFVNQGNGTFREEAAKWGVADSRWSYAAVFADVNGDGRLDLFVANDFGEKAMFINQGDRFVDEARERGVLDPGNGMGAAFGDFDNDGLLDLHATNMSSTAGNRILARLFPQSSAKDNVLLKLASGNSLFKNTGNGYYREVTAETGGLSAGWAWGGGFLDIDNDGWEDLYSPNGFISGKSMKDT